MRLEHDDNLSCLSRNARHCLWNNDVTDPTLIPEQDLKPLVCGQAHQKSVWGINGYNDQRAGEDNGDFHWCRSAYATLFVKWKDYSVVGVDYWLSETPAGDAMCHSTNGKTCTRVVPGDAPPSDSVIAHPLVCGAHHRRMWGTDGYSDPNHWCATPKIDEDLGTHVATSNWTRIEAAGWAAAIEPAMLIRAKVPATQSLTLGAHALRSRSAVDGGPPFQKAFFGLEFGKRLRFHLDGKDVVPPEESWKKMAASGDEVILGMTVTPGGNACFFGAKTGAERAGHFFAKANFLGSTLKILDDAKHPLKFKASSANWRSVKSLVDLRINDGDALPIEQMLMLYARQVPEEGDPPGKEKRWIHYATDCDKT
ncbi:hypothetical protein ABE85_22440 [Mitsuaria sp. 7]|nr:hypothetical protein ABE85_22440 [Mitsuaria sp. 7]